MLLALAGFFIGFHVRFHRASSVFGVAFFYLRQRVLPISLYIIYYKHRLKLFASLSLLSKQWIFVVVASSLIHRTRRTFLIIDFSFLRRSPHFIVHWTLPIENISLCSSGFSFKPCASSVSFARA